MQFVATKSLDYIRNYESMNLLKYNGLYIYYDHSFEKYEDSKKIILLSGVIFNKDINEVTTDFNDLEFGPILIYIDKISDDIYFLNDKFKVVTIIYDVVRSVITNNWMFLNSNTYYFNGDSVNSILYNPRLHAIKYNKMIVSPVKVYSFDITHNNDIDYDSHTNLIEETIQNNIDKILKRYKKPLFMCSPRGVDSNLIAQCIEKNRTKVQTYTRWGNKLDYKYLSFYQNITDSPTIKYINDYTPEINSNKNWSLNGRHAWHYFLDDFPDNLDYDCILLGTNGDNALPHTAEMAFSVDYYDDKEKRLVEVLKKLDISKGLTPFHSRIISEWAKKYRDKYFFNDKGILGFVGYLQKKFNLIDCMFFIENIGYIQELGLQKNKPIITPFYDTRLYQILLKTKKEHLNYILNSEILTRNVLKERFDLVDEHRNQTEGLFETDIYYISNDFKDKLFQVYVEMSDISSKRTKEKLVGLYHNIADRDSFELLLKHNFKVEYEKNSIRTS